MNDTFQFVILTSAHQPHLLLKSFLFSLAGRRAVQLHCLDCFGEGQSAQNAQENCDKNIVSEDCEEEKMVCGVASFQTDDGFEFNRGCLTREEYNEYAAECEGNTEGTCVVAMCDTTNCSPDELLVVGGK